MAKTMTRAKRSVLLYVSGQVERRGKEDGEDGGDEDEAVKVHVGLSVAGLVARRPVDAEDVVAEREREEHEQDADEERDH
eukprot:1427327-Rhodomonas_salina.1